jgi:Family of unknown function (DUF6704)
MADHDPAPSADQPLVQPVGHPHEPRHAHNHAVEHESHGHSVAAWSAVTIILVGALVMALAVVFPSVLLFVVGALVAVTGVVVGKLLAMAGYGGKSRSDELESTAGTH